MKKLNSYFNSGKVSLKTYEELKKLNDEELKKELKKLGLIKSKKLITLVTSGVFIFVLVLLMLTLNFMSNYKDMQKYCVLTEEQISACHSKIIFENDIMEVKNILGANSKEVVLTEKEWEQKYQDIKNEYLELGYSDKDYLEIEKTLYDKDKKKLISNLEINLEKKTTDLEKKKSEMINELKNFEYQYTLKEEKLLLQVNELTNHLTTAKADKENEDMLALEEEQKQIDDAKQEEIAEQTDVEKEVQTPPPPKKAPSYCYLSFDDANNVGMNMFISSPSIEELNIGKFEVIEQAGSFCPYFYSDDSVYTVEDLK